MNPEQLQRCRNCGGQLMGEYCAACGQRERGRDLTVWDFAGEALEDLGQVDGRVWRTVLGLLVKPGRVTADYLAGRRACYLPPGIYVPRDGASGDYGGVVLLAMFIYLPIAMVRTYGSGMLAAVGKSLVVGVSYYLLALTVGAVYLLIKLALL